MADNFNIPAHFTVEDYRLLLEALDEYETGSHGLFGMIEKAKEMGVPEEGSMPDEVRDAIIHFRQHLLGQEEDAKRNREVRRERATLLKAKIILMNQRRAAERMIEDASGTPPWLKKECQEDG